MDMMVMSEMCVQSYWDLSAREHNPRKVPGKYQESTKKNQKIKIRYLQALLEAPLPSTSPHAAYRAAQCCR
jgi:hypothetical protein